MRFLCFRTTVISESTTINEPVRENLGSDQVQHKQPKKKKKKGQAVQSQKKVSRSLKFRIFMKKRSCDQVYYPCSEAELRLCFRICKNPVF